MKIRVVREGFPFVFPPLVLSLLFLGLWMWYALLPCLLLTLFFAFFFREPLRQVTPDNAKVLSPADGTVLNVRELTEGEFSQRIDIFMSVFNVHVNRAPVSGKIDRVLYRRGKKFPADSEKASVENESNYVEIRSEENLVAFKQIAGILARRIVFDHPAGEWVTQGERVGMIKFGSRVEVFLDNTFRVSVRKGEKVRGGETVLAVRS